MSKDTQERDKAEKWDGLIRLLPKYIYEYGTDTDDPTPLEELPPEQILEIVAHSWFLIEINNKEVKDRKFITKTEFVSLLQELQGKVMVHIPSRQVIHKEYSHEYI